MFFYERKSTEACHHGMLAALSIVLVYVIHFPIFPAASFLEYDPADIPSSSAPLPMVLWRGFC